jgi:hypothetical protein
MSGTNPLPLGRQREIAVQEALANLAPLLEQLREALPLVNDEAQGPRLDRLRAFADSAALVLQRRGGTTDQAMIDDIATLLGNLHQLRLPARDPDMGLTVGLKAVNGAQGQIAMVPIAILTAGNALRLRPSQPEIAQIDTTELPKGLLAGKLAALEKRLDDMVAGLDRLQAANVPTRIGLVTFYLGEMRVEANLAKLSLTIGDTTIDFASLTRAVEAMVRLTGDFVATLRGWAERVAATIRVAGDALLRPVRRVARGVRSAVGWMSHKLHAAHQRSGTPNPGYRAAARFQSGCGEGIDYGRQEGSTDLGAVWHGVEPCVLRPDRRDAARRADRAGGTGPDGHARHRCQPVTAAETQDRWWARRVGAGRIRHPAHAFQPQTVNARPATVPLQQSPMKCERHPRRRDLSKRRPMGGLRSASVPLAPLAVNQSEAQPKHRRRRIVRIIHRERRERKGGRCQCATTP